MSERERERVSVVTGQTEAGTLVRTDWDGRQLSTGHDEVLSVSCRDSATEQSVLSLSPGKPVVGECGISLVYNKETCSLCLCLCLPGFKIC